MIKFTYTVGRKSNYIYISGDFSTGFPICFIKDDCRVIYNQDVPTSTIDEFAASLLSYDNNQLSLQLSAPFNKFEVTAEHIMIRHMLMYIIIPTTTDNLRGLADVLTAHTDYIRESRISIL